MRFLKSILLLSATISFFLLSSCSDDTTTNPTDNANYFPSKSGNFWVYESVTKNDQDQDVKTVDSTVSTGVETKLSKQASVYKNFVDGQSTTTSYDYVDNQKLFQLIAGFLPDQSTLGFPLPLEVPDAWALMADMNATAGWDIATIPLTDLQIDLPGTGPIKIKSGNIKFTGLKGGKSDVTAAGKTFSAQEFTINSIFTSVISITYNGFPIDVNLNFTITTKRYYADKVGLVKSTALPTTISAKALGTVEVFKREFKGSTSTLLRYNVN